MTTAKSIGAFLRTAREAAEMSLRQVERETGVSNAYLSQLESDRIKEPSPNVLFRLTECYGADYDTAMRLVGYPAVRSSEEPRPSNALGRLGHVTPKEVDALAEYLEFIRRRRRT